MRNHWCVALVVLVGSWQTSAVAQQREPAGPEAEEPSEPPAAEAPPQPRQIGEGPGSDEAASEKPAGEEPASEEPDAEARQLAREAYERGQRHFALGEYPAAKVAFEEAFAHVPNPVVLLSIAECQERLGELPAAVETLQRYLELRPDAPDRAEVEQQLAELRATPAVLVISSEPSGARVLIDGEDSGQLTPAEIEVPAGSHKVTVIGDEGQGAEKTVDVAIGMRHELHADIPPPPEPAPPPPPEPAPQPPSKTGVWISFGLAGAGAIAGGVLGVLALKEHSDFEDAPSEASADRGERLALFADVGFGVAIMGALTGLVLLITEGEPATGDADPQQVKLTPTFAGSSAGVTGEVHF